MDICTTTSLSIHLLVELLELTNEYSKVTGYNLNIQKCLALLYTNNEKSEREIKETVTVTTATERVKYLGIYLPKGGLSFCRRAPDELWNEVRDIVQETGIKTIPMEKKCKKAKWLSGEDLQIAVKRSEKQRRKGKI